MFCPSASEEQSSKVPRRSRVFTQPLPIADVRRVAAEQQVGEKVEVQCGHKSLSAASPKFTSR